MLIWNAWWFSNCFQISMINLDRNKFVHWNTINIQTLFEHFKQNIWDLQLFKNNLHIILIAMKHHWKNSCLNLCRLKLYFTFNVWIKKMPDVSPAGVISTEVPHFKGHTLQWCHFLHVRGSCWYGLN